MLFLPFSSEGIAVSDKLDIAYSSRQVAPWAWGESITVDSRVLSTISRQGGVSKNQGVPSLPFPSPPFPYPSLPFLRSRPLKFS